MTIPVAKISRHETTKYRATAMRSGLPKGIARHIHVHGRYEVVSIDDAVANIHGICWDETKTGNKEKFET